MKRWIIAAASTLGLSIAALVGVVAYTAIGRARGENWSSLNGPEPVWPAVVGFGAMYVIPISALLLVVLVVSAIVRAYMPRSADRT
ncbi:hypothetical protein GCM10027057_26950 [Marisediminicola antarctica]|uniref:Multidrug ABC transporter ATPase n=1 Tax=Marisediminicola antarctica TaxID=674079 RepID=A0A7L5AKP5_9MICO|nr:hypothetical protein BHD05_03705 [Marisediminicola antarctica]